jgi:iron complex outermembrane receptor protein
MTPRSNEISSKCRNFVCVVFLPLALLSFTRAENSPPTDTGNPLKQLTLEQLGNIEVTTASKEPEEVWSTPAAIYVITQDDIRRSGATSIADALRLAPGVEVSRISSTTWAVGIRGLQSNFSKSVLVLIDGRSVYTPLFSGVYWDVQDVVLENIDRIEVIRGPGGTVWGPNAVNGVINIIRKSSADTHGLMVSASAGTFDHTIDQIQYGGAWGKKFSYRVYGKGFARGPEFHYDGNNFDAWHQERGGFRMDRENDRDSLMLEGDVYGGDSPHQIGTTNVDDSVSGGSLVARWRRNLKNGSDLYFETYIDRTIRVGAQLGETRNTLDFDFLHHIKFGNRHDFIYGGGLRWSPNHFIQKQTSIDLLPHDETDHIYTGFVQDEIHLADNHVSLTFGAKLSHNNFSKFDIQPTARILWAPTPHQSIWAAVTRAVTTPSRIEEDFELTGQVSVNPPILLRVAGDPQFKSETLLGIEAGYRKLITGQIYLDVSIFHNNYRNLQSFGASVASTENSPPPPHLVLTIPYANAIAGTTNGIEIAPSWQPTPWFRLTGSYSFVGIDLHANAPSLDISDTGSVNTYEGSTPHHQVEVQSTFNLPKGFEFDQFYRYASALPAQKVEAYSTVDFHFGWNYGRHIKVAVVGQNLLQPHHNEWGTGDPAQTPLGIRRAAYAKITWMQ